jgi:hypothetical protein
LPYTPILLLCPQLSEDSKSDAERLECRGKVRWKPQENLQEIVDVRLYYRSYRNI